MPNRDHQQAQELSVQAKLRLDASDFAEAQRLYAEAANLERKAFVAIPPEKKRTRSILAVSFASLLYKAKEFNVAETEIYRILSMAPLTASSRHQLRELLEVVWDEQALLREGYQYAQDDLLVALRGGEIGSGTAPIDLVVQKANGFKTFLYRVAEWLEKHPFRIRGQPSSDIRHALQLRATQPAPGSYRFAVRLVEPAQGILFEEMKESIASAGEVASSALRIMQILNSGNAAELGKYIPEDDYRRAFTGLLRNITPTKHDAREIEVRRRAEPRDEKVILVRWSRHAINQIMKSELKEDTEIREVRGTLRALDLDRRWVKIVSESGEKRPCKTPPDFLDDVVGPMVNRSVIAYGKVTKKVFLLRDIELDEEADD